MRFAITTLVEGKVLVTEFDNYAEAWEVFMHLGRLPEVKHVALEPIVRKGAFNVAVRRMVEEEVRHVRSR
jgi:hypothetical protein